MEKNVLVVNFSKKQKQNNQNQAKPTNQTKKQK